MKQIAERRIMMKHSGKLKNNLDERQEQLMLEVEHRGCWLAFWGLLVALMVQMVLGMDFSYMAGEWIVFMALAVYIVEACIKRGLWDRHLKPDMKTNLVFSIVSAIAFGAVIFATVYHRVPDKIGGSIAAGVFSAGFLFVILFASLSVMAGIVIKRQKSLEAEPEEDGDDLNHTRCQEIE